MEQLFKDGGCSSHFIAFLLACSRSLTIGLLFFLCGAVAVP
jgi:hypothetical protein